MDEVWERAMEAALEGQAESSSAPRTLTLDGAVKCLHGRLPPPALLEKFQSLEHLSIANVGVSSLEKFPCLRNLQRLILSDNRIAGGLEFLVEAGLDSLRDLDLSNNRIQFLDDLSPLARLRLVSLDLYECPVTRINDYRSRVFGMIRSLKYLDKLDADENERLETDDEDEDGEEEDEEDPGSGEVDGEDRAGKAVLGMGGSMEGGGIVDADDDEESDADEEMENGGRAKQNGSDWRSHEHSNGFCVAAVGMASGEGEDVEEEDVEDDDDENFGEEIDEEEGEEEDVVEVHEIDGSDEEDGEGVEEEEDGEGVGVEEEDEGEGVEEDGGDEDEEEVENEEGDGEIGNPVRMMSMEGEIDGHEQGEEDENGEIGDEDEQGLEKDREYQGDDGEGDDEEEDLGAEYLVQPTGQPEVEEDGGSDFEACNEEDESEEEVDDDHLSNGVLQHPSSSSLPNKRKRDEEDHPDRDSVEDSRSSKHH